jgi:hypothetical protein
LKSRANLFRRKYYSSQADISNHRSSLPADHIQPSHRIKAVENNSIALQRSNSMICPQQRLQTLLNNNSQRNSICEESSSCSTNDYRFIKSSSDRYWNKNIFSKMSNINEQDTFPSEESLNENKIKEGKSTYQSILIINLFAFLVSSLPNDNNKQTSVILPASQLAKSVIREEQKQQLIPPVTSSSSAALVSRDNDETIQISHSNITSLQQKRSLSDGPFYDCKQQPSPIKSTANFHMSLATTSTCTMTGKSLNNLDECLSTASSEDKGVQTTFNDSMTTTSCIKRNNSSTSLSSSSTSIQTDSLENRPKISILSQTKHPIDSYIKWSHIHNRLLGEQTCIYWVNYLGKIRN